MESKKILSCDISFVVQGIVNNDTKLVLDAIRYNFPDSEIILSTWLGTSLGDELIYDTLVLNEDPGAFLCIENNNEYFYNLDRQLVSTKNGIYYASKKYVAKIRSDLFINDTFFLNFYNKQQDRTTSDLSIFKEKILVGDVYSRNPLKMGIRAMLFHVGDFFYFGLKEDVFKLFNIPLSKNDVAQYFLYRKEKNPYSKEIFFRYTPEQYIIIKNLQKISKYQMIELKHHYHINLKLFLLHMIFLVSNFQLFELKNSGIKSLKYQMIMDNNLYTRETFTQLQHMVIHQQIVRIFCQYLFYRLKVLLKQFERSIRKFSRKGLT